MHWLPRLQALFHGTHRVHFSSTKPPFDNKALREAVMLAVDREGIVKGLLFGKANVAYGVVPPGAWAYDADIHPVKRDLAKAKAKLAEGGKPNGFKFEMLTQNSPVHIQFIEAVKSQLAEMGIDAELRPMAAAELSPRQASKDLPFEAVASAWPGRPELDETFTLLSHSKGGQNLGRYGASAPKVDRLIEQARGTTDVKARKDFYKQVQLIVNDESLDIFVYFRNDIYAMNPKVQNLIIWPDSKMRFKEVWKVK
ncbi:MAG: hypothetical protein HY675_16735 [Chloroflexi bacterium]|nr:hypothetical protein [Chloroflexota bacterium]